ncbi:hypothetical protein HK099_000671 [Clydaea vesicula]|uniref:Uncharacterized protein n=1 Tax=Clydaea vesicula TaxID=447962 RepID=A0AAD5XVE0_9FUNG|nr:hypothetical protein HK099_000671 [Clydaea vesicula]
MLEELNSDREDYVSTKIKQTKVTEGSKALLNYKAYTFVNQQQKKKNSDSIHKHTKSCNHSTDPTHNHHNHSHEKEKSNNDNQKPLKVIVGDSVDKDPTKPFELRIGLKFSVPSFETCVKTMNVGEKSRFLIMPEKLDGYIGLETALRKEKQNKILAEKGLPIKRQMQSNCCANQFNDVENKDLLDILSSPLELEIHLLDVLEYGTFEKEVWEMKNEERLTEAPKLKEEGNELYNKGNYVEACTKFSRALMLLESITISTEVLDSERERIEELKIAERDKFKPAEEKKIETVPAKSAGFTFDPDFLHFTMQSIRLNYSACKLKLQDYSTVIQQCTEIINKLENFRSSNEFNYFKNKNLYFNYLVKALFRRAKAFSLLGRDLELSKNDLMACKKVLEAKNEFNGSNSSKDFDALVHEIKQEELILEKKFKDYLVKEKKIYSNIFS